MLNALASLLMPLTSFSLHKGITKNDELDKRYEIEKWQNK